ncbi:Rad2 nuclease [Tulasnella sp. 419]|nr:Rad2 nuclease [Tulasnella sp. 419]
MGIQGLLPLLKSIQVHTHISSFKDQTLGVDGYVWLHKGGFACAPQLVQGQKTTKYVDYVLHRIRMLRHYGVEPYLVFDGGPLPAKKGTESERSKNREENLAKAKALQARGQHTLAREYFTKCLDVTPEMAYQVIKALKKESVSYTVAPYEADAQLTYLEQTGIIDGIITEDSDLLVFGCKKVIFKMDPDGNCVCIERDRFGSNVDLSLAGWGDKEFRRMAMLSGCDYLPSITGMGIKTAHKLLRKFKTVEKVLQHLRVDSNLRVPKEYYESFVMAELPFLYQRVYCPIKEQLTYLTPLSDFEEWSPEKEAYVGRLVDYCLDDWFINLMLGLGI